MRALVLPICLGVLAAACAMLWPACDALFQEPGAAGSLGAREWMDVDRSHLELVGEAPPRSLLPLPLVHGRHRIRLSIGVHQTGSSSSPQRMIVVRGADKK